MSKKTYTIVTAVDHDNQRYEPGASITLNDEQAETLVIAKAITGPTGDAPSDVPTDAAERLAAITNAIGQLDPNNTDQWLKDGKPSGEAIAAVLGWPVTAAERNAAWTTLSA